MGPSSFSVSRRRPSVSSGEFYPAGSWANPPTSGIQEHPGCQFLPPGRFHAQLDSAVGPLLERLAGMPLAPLQEPVYEPIYNDLPAVEEEDVVYQPF